MFKLVLRILWVISSLAYVAYALISTEFFATGDDPFESGYITFCLICALFALPTIIEHIKKEFAKAKKTERVQYSIHGNNSDGYRIKKESDIWISVFIIVALEILFSPIALLVTVIKNITFITKSVRNSRSDVGYNKKGYGKERHTSANDKFDGLENAEWYRNYEKLEKIAAQNVLDRSYTGYIDLYIDSELVKFKLISRIRKGDIVYATLHPIDEPMELSNCMFCRVDPKANEIFQYMYVLDPNIPEELNEIDKVITKTAELLNKRANDSEQKQTYSTPDKYEGLEEADYYRSYEKAEKTAAKNIFDPTFSGHIELPFDSGTIEKFKILYRIKKGDIVYAILLNENDPLEVRNFNFVRVDPKEENELFKYVYFLDPKDDEEFNEIDIVMKKYREGLKKING